MSEPKWTEKQSEAINAPPCRILISAAAGSGKTAVLVERICRRITDPETRADIDRFLVVTFTNSAAAGVREKIVNAIFKKLAKNPTDAHLERQLALISKAHIDTIAAFCLDLIRRYFHLLSISPDFRILDDNDHELLKNDVLTQLVEDWHRGERGEEFRYMCDFFCTGRDDRSVFELLLRISRFLESLPNPEQFLENQKGIYAFGETVGPFDTAFGFQLFLRADSLAHYAFTRIKKALELCQTDAGLCEKTLPVFAYDFEFVKNLIAAVQSKDYTAIRNASKDYAPIRFASPRGFEDKALLELLKSCRAEIKAAFAELTSFFAFSEEQIKSDFHAMAKPVATLCDFLSELRAALWAEKCARGVMYFSDIEHLALKLLVSEIKEDGSIVKTEVARECAEQFDEVYIDEYQDINELQDLIFRAISRDEKNIFMVGDVKQSIYRFRQSEPQIFLNKRDESDSASKIRIDLSHNFRSRAPVLEFTNYIFSKLMTKSGLGELDYSGDELLVPGAAYAGESSECEVNFLKNYRADEDEERGRPEREAAFTAARIQNLVDGKRLVTDEETKELRPIRYSDIVILMRSTASVAPIYQKVFEEAGVPIRTEMGGDFFEREEIMSCISLLRAIDNPNSDIDLIAAMRSELFSFSSEMLAEIRANHKDGSFYEAVKAGGEKTAYFLQKLGDYRLLSQNVELPSLILKISRDLRLPDIASASEDGALKKRNVRLLYQYACSYRDNGLPGLFGFLHFVDRLRERGGSFAAAGGSGENANAVQIMTIHKSKGLEFPVVFVCDCSRRFNLSDTQGRFLMHKKLGFGLKLRDTKRDVEFETFTRIALSVKLRAESLSEEMRNLYVALTRAKEHLIIVGTVDISKSGGIVGFTESSIEDGAVLSEQLMKSGSYTGWLLSVLQHHQAGGELRGELADGCEIITGPDIKLFLHEPLKYKVKNREVEQKRETLEEAPNLEELRARLDFKYPYSGSCNLPEKLSVSAAAALAAGGTDAAEEKTEKSSISFLELILKRENPSGAERGTALHRFMQFARLDAMHTRSEVEGELLRLSQGDYLTERAASLVDCDKVVTFLQSDLCARIRASNQVMRERRFDLLFSRVDFEAAGVLGQLDSLCPEDRILIQGVIDCAFVENGGFTVLDFKTDFADDPALLVGRYGAQLRLYARALTLLSGISCKKMVLYSFHSGKEIEVV